MAEMARLARGIPSLRLPTFCDDRAGVASGAVDSRRNNIGEPTTVLAECQGLYGECESHVQVRGCRYPLMFIFPAGYVKGIPDCGENHVRYVSCNQHSRLTGAVQRWTPA